MDDSELERRFEHWVERHLRDGTSLDVAEVCADRPDLAAPLASLVEEYRRATAFLDGEQPGAGDHRAGAADLPVFEGFRTIERVGAGGAGEVYRLQDLTLNRVVAAKVLRGDPTLRTSLSDFLREARALALFDDPRIVRVFEFRADTEPATLIMEYVDGFDLSRVGPSLEIRQRVRIVKDICEAVHRAHELGLQHRDLKPSNVRLDAGLQPKILDFGLSRGDPAVGHFRGTPEYLAPEQLDPSAPIDARTDVYGIGAILYELLCGVAPITGHDTTDVVARVKAGTIRLPVDVQPGVPEPLQAIALKALERRARDRYPTALDMAADLGRYLDGRPVDARPSQYSAALSARVRAHVDHVQEWLRLKLIYPHEAVMLRAVYRKLERRDDDWIGEARALSYSQIALYLGAFLLMCGSLFYFGAHRLFEAVDGVARPFVVLGVPFIGLNVAAHLLARRDHRAVAVAFYLGGVSLLPLFLLILFHERGLWLAAPDTAGQLFSDGAVSNRQLQVTIAVACAWTAWLAARTRTLALSTVLAVLTFLLTLAILADAGLRAWFEEERWDALALHLMPLVPVYAGAALWCDHSGRPWFGRPFYTAAGVLFIAVLELFALDGRMLHVLHLSLQPWQPEGVSNPVLLDTLAAMSFNGLVFYVAASVADRHGSELVKPAAWILFTVAPFAVLEPLARLSQTGEYTRAVDWAFLALALATAVVSHRRQRRSFYYAGLLNTGVALFLIADHYQWFDQPNWAMVLVAVGLAVLWAGFALNDRERRRHLPGTEGE
jgi:hypothetical protein